MRIGIGLLLIALIAGAGRAELVSDDTKPMTPGTHHLKFPFDYDGRLEIMTYGLYLPPNAEQVFAEGGKLPMVVFMVGAGSRGKTADKLHREGPLGGIKRSESFAKTVDYAVLVPQVPRRGRWENARMGTFVAEATRRAIERWPIDPDRVHLVGSSMGGEGAWHAGLAGADVFATVTSVAGRGHPDPNEVAKALKDRTTLIIVGSGDEDFTTGSKRMANAFTRVGADVTLIVVPGRDHSVGRFYNRQPRFYEWILKHKRGAPLPADRASREELLNLAVNPPGDQTYRKFSEKMQSEFSEFRPYWYIELSGMIDEAGYHEELHGSKKVFVTHPLNNAIPCRIMHTTRVRKNQITKLVMEVAYAENNPWDLVVNVECYKKLSKRIGPSDKDDSKARPKKDDNAQQADASDGKLKWQTVTVDLTAYQGKEVFIEVLNKSARRHKPHAAYWRRIELVNEKF